MNLAKILSALVTLNIAFTATVAVLFIIGLVLKRGGRHLCAADELRMHYFIVVLLILFSLGEWALPRHETAFAPVARVWAAASSRTFEKIDADSHRGVVDFGRGIWQTNDRRETWMLLALVAVIFAPLFKIGRDVATLRRWLRRSFLIRRIGRVEIYASESTIVPFSFWLPGRACVVVPLKMIRSQMALAHELQHHRQGDTRWVYALAGLRALCIANPVFYFWFKWISELQEYACDEALIDQGRVDSLAYARNARVFPSAQREWRSRGDQNNSTGGLR